MFKFSSAWDRPTRESERPAWPAPHMPERLELEPENADAWYHLGVSYLEQVEADARVLLSRHRDSAYVEMLMAETFAEQRAFIQADEAYKKVLAFPQIPAGAHAGYGFVLLNRHEP